METGQDLIAAPGEAFEEVQFDAPFAELDELRAIIEDGRQVGILDAKIVLAEKLEIAARVVEIGVFAHLDGEVWAATLLEKLFAPGHHRLVEIHTVLHAFNGAKRLL